MKATCLCVSACFVSLACASIAQASYILLQDFEDVALGANLADANPGESFSMVVQGGQSPSATVELAPWAGGGKAAKVTNPGATLFMPVSIPQGTTATLFYQLYRTGLVNMSSGMSDVASIGDHNFGNFESQLNINALAEPQVFKVRDAGAFSTSTTNFDISSLYNIWHVIDNQADTTKFYVQKVGVDPAPVLIEINSKSAFTFRNGVANNNLVNFLFMTGTANATDAAHTTVYFDNIYLDPTGENLTNPIPEPASLWLLAAAALAGACVRRRRR